jgi:hypothetical protein
MVGNEKPTDWCILYNSCDYYLTLLVIHKRLNIWKNNPALMAMYSFRISTGTARRDLATPLSLVPSAGRLLLFEAVSFKNTFFFKYHGFWF